MVRFDTPRLVTAIERFIRSQRAPHLIHSFGQWGYVGVVLRERSRRAGIAVTAINSVYGTARHGSDGKIRGLSEAHGVSRRLFFRAERLWIRLIVSRCESRAYAESRLVTLNYESVRQIYLGEFGPAAEVRRLPYAAEAAFLNAANAEPAPEPPDIAAVEPRTAPLLVSVSRHDPRKGVDVFLRALGQLKAAGVPFRACVVSGGPLLEAHRRLADRLGLGATATLTGWVPDSFRYLQHADIFVQPALQESSGSLAMLEAMQARLTVIASQVDGMPEDVTDGDSALLFEPGNVDALSLQLTRVLADSLLRRRLARRARETFEARFSAEALTNALGDVYAELGFKDGVGQGQIRGRPRSMPRRRG
jgi:glycosyltransferase involved in cell wall biosynthesis